MNTNTITNDFLLAYNFDVSGSFSEGWNIVTDCRNEQTRIFVGEGGLKVNTPDGSNLDGQEAGAFLLANASNHDTVDADILRRAIAALTVSKPMITITNSLSPDPIAWTGQAIGENTTSPQAQIARLEAELAERKALDAKAGGTERVTLLEDGSVVTVRSDDDENGDSLWETYYQDASDASCRSESREHGDLPVALAYHDSIAGAGVTIFAPRA